MHRRLIPLTGFIAFAMLAACSLLPTESLNDDKYRQDLDVCTARSAAEHQRTQQLVGRNSTAANVADPLSPSTLAASNANAALSRCLQSRGHAGQ